MYVKIGRYMRDEDPEDWERTEIIRIHRWDLWNADVTLASVIHPILVKLKELKDGYPNEFAEPEDFGPNTYPEDMIGGGWESWEKVLDTMIWSFKEIMDDDYITRLHDEFVNPNDTDDKSWCHKVMEHDKKIQEGLTNFGRWYRALWT